MIREMTCCLSLGLVLSVAACSASDSPSTDAGASGQVEDPTSSQSHQSLEYITYRTSNQPPAADNARITGILNESSGCLVLRGSQGDRLLSFDADHTKLVGRTLVLSPRLPGQKTLRLELGDQLVAGGGYRTFESGTEADPSLSVPPNCRKVTSPEIAAVESW